MKYRHFEVNFYDYHLLQRTPLNDLALHDANEVNLHPKILFYKHKRIFDH
jgi:hypothetical protein